MNNFETLPDRKSKVKKAVQSIEKARKKLSQEEGNEEAKEMLLEAVRNFFIENGASESENIQEELNEIRRGSSVKMLVRKHFPEDVMNAVSEKKPIKLTFEHIEGKKACANAVRFDQDVIKGVSIALREGRSSIAQGAASFVVGFEEGPEMKVSDIPDSKHVNITGSDRVYSKIAEGEIPFKNIKFVLVRFPRKLFPEGQMSEREESLSYINRIYTFNENEKEAQ